MRFVTGAITHRLLGPHMVPISGGAIARASRLNDTNGIPRRVLRPLVFLLGAVLAAGSLVAPTAVRAAGSTFRIDPPSTPAAVGDTFSVQVVSTTSGLLAGARASVVFDPARLQVTSVTRGPDWVAAGATFSGFPDASAIAGANGTGKLPAIAAFFADEVSTLSGGDHALVSLTFAVIACGSVSLDLPVGPTDAAFIDGSSAAYGTFLAVDGTTAGAVVDPCIGQPAGPPGSPAIQPATGTVDVSGTLDAGFLGLTVPAHVTIPLVRNALNSTNLGVEITSDISWSLTVVDSGPSPSTGHMASGPNHLAAAMEAVVPPGSPINLELGGQLATGTDNASVPVRLDQQVDGTDKPGTYSINLLFQAISSF